MEQLDVSYITGGNVEWMIIVCQFLIKLNIQLAYNTAIIFLGIYPREVTFYVYTINLYMNLHSSFICNSPKLQTTEMPLSRWMVK